MTATPLEDGWCFYVLPFDLAYEHFDEFKPIIKLYRDKLTNGDGFKLPTWKSFKFADFKGWHHHIALSEVDEENYMPRFRIMPTGIVDILNRDLTGQTLDTIMENTTRKKIQTHIKNLMQGPYIGLTTGRMSKQNDEMVFFASLYLPLTILGEKVEQFIHVISLDN